MKVYSNIDMPEIIKNNTRNTSCELERLYYTHNSRRMLKWHHYLSIYDFHLKKFKNIERYLKSNPLSSVAKEGILKILEIGVHHGGSLQMWRKYFGSVATIYGIDIDPRCKDFEEDGCHIRIGNQADPEFLRSIIDEMGSIDIVIDDGSHINSHQLASFKALFKELNYGGLYIVEDLHTSYWEGDWEGGLKKPGTFIEVAKDIIDHMHAWYTEVNTELDDINIKTCVTGLHIYESMLVIEKNIKDEPYAVKVGKPSF